MLHADQLDLPAIDCIAMAHVVEKHAIAWGWDARFTGVVLGKLKRGLRLIEPLNEAAAATILSMCREGHGLHPALKQARVTQRRYFAWIAKAHSAEDDAAPYLRFRSELRVAMRARIKETGSGTQTEIDQIVP
jgi:hypothetical protein